MNIFFFDPFGGIVAAMQTLQKCYHEMWLLLARPVTWQWDDHRADRPLLGAHSHSLSYLLELLLIN